MRRGMVMLIFLVFMAGIISPTMAIAQNSPQFELVWFSLDSAGGTIDVGSYRMAGSAGQPEGDQLSGDEFTLSGGFWPGIPQRFTVRLPFVKR